MCTAPLRSAIVSSAFEHTALLYDDRDALASELVTTIEGDVAHDGAVLLCVPDDLAVLVLDAIVEQRERVDQVHENERYTRPIGALDALWRFTTRSRQQGRAFVHSIGEIGFTGAPSDDDWHWYEAAVNEVVPSMAVRATCLYDTERLPDTSIEHARATHPEIREHATTIASSGFRAGHVPTRTPLAVPDREPDVLLQLVTTSRAARRALCTCTVALERNVMDRAAIVVSELVTNAALHGGGHAVVDMWL